MANGRINFTVGFNVDQSGLNQLKTSLTNLQNLKTTDLVGIDATKSQQELNKIKESAKQVETALQASFNPVLNTYNIDQFKQKLVDSGLSLNTLRTQFSSVGAQGTIAFRNLTTAITSTKLPLQESHNLLRSMGNTLMNTIKWSIASSAINTVTSSVQKAWSYTQELDKSLNDIMIVTDKSSDAMAQFAKQANKAAKELGKSTTDYTNASLIYYQQGLSDTEVKARTETTLKAANITGQSTDAVSEQLTAVWNGYKVNADEAELYVDKLSAVAATTAADLEELSTGMSKVASAANNMGVDMDQLNAQLATVISVTKQAPETVGTAFKTIFARISDIEAGLEEETTLGEYTAQMAKMGIYVLDANNHLRDMGDVIEEIGGKWTSLSREQQVSLAQTMAGTRQYNNLLALFENWNMYESAMKTSIEATGTLQKQQDIYMDSIEAHLEQLSAAGERVYQAIFDADSAKDLIDVLTRGVDLFANFTESIGGGGTLLMALIPLMTKLFSGTISSGVATFVANMQNARNTTASLKSLLENIKEIRLDGDSFTSDYDQKINKLRENLILLKQQGIVTNEEFNHLTDSINAFANAANEYEVAQSAYNPSLIGDQMFNLMQSGFGEKVAGQSAPLTSSSMQNYINRVAQMGQNNPQTEEQLTNLINQQGIESFSASGENAYKRLQEQLRLMNEEFQTAKTNAKNLNSEIKTADSFETFQLKSDKALTSFNNALKQSLVYSEKIQKSGFLTGADLTHFNNATISLQKFQKQLPQTQAEFEELQSAISEYDRLTQKAMSNGMTKTKAMESTLKDLAMGGATQAKESMNQFGASAEAAFAKANLEKRINQFTQLASNIGMAVSSITMLINIGDIWDNEDLTFGEKMLQTIQNIAFATSMLTPLISGLGKAYAGKKAAMAATNVENIKSIGYTEAFKTLEKEENDQLTKNATLRWLLDTYCDDLNDELKEELATRLALGEAIEEENEELIKNTALNKINKDGKKGTHGQMLKEALTKTKTNTVDFGKGFGKGFIASGSKGALTAGGSSGAAGIGSALGAIAPYVLAIAAVAVATWGVFKIIDTKNREEEEKWKKTAEAAKSAQEEANKVRQEYEALEQSINSLESAKTTLEELTEGTVEWKKALLDVNSQVIELLNKYPELAEYINRDLKTGELSINEKGIDLVLANQLQEMQEAQAGAAIARVQNNRAEIEYRKNEYAEAAIYGSQENADKQLGQKIGGTAVAGVIGGGLGIAASAGLFGATLGSIAPGIGTAIGAVAGVVIGGAIALATAESDERREEAFKKTLDESQLDILADAYITSGESIFNSTEALEKALGDNKSELDLNTQALIENKEETKALIEAYSKQRAQQELDWITAGEAIVGPDASDSEKFLAGQRLDELTDVEAVKKEFKGWNQADEKAIKEYLSLIGADPTAFEGTKGKNMGQWEINDEQFDKSMDWIYAEIARLRAINEAKEEDTNKYNSANTKIAGTVSTKEAKNLLSLIAAGAKENINFTSLTKEAFNDLEKNAEKIKEVLGDDEWNIFQAKFEEGQRAWVDVWNTIPETWRNGLININELTLTQAEGLATQFNDLYKITGAKGVEALQDIINSAGSKSTEFLNQILSTEFEAGKIKDQISDIAESLNIDVDSKQLSDYAYSLEVVYGTGKSALETLQENYKSIIDTAKGLSQFDTVSKKYWESLSKDARSYFTQMADGTYMLIDSANEFYAKVYGEKKQKFQTNLENAIATESQKEEAWKQARDNAVIARSRILNKDQDPELQKLIEEEKNRATEIVKKGRALDSALDQKLAAEEKLNSVLPVPLTLQEHLAVNPFIGKNDRAYYQSLLETLRNPLTTEERDFLEKYTGQGYSLDSYNELVEAAWDNGKIEQIITSEWYQNLDIESLDEAQTTALTEWKTAQQELKEAILPTLTVTETFSDLQSSYNYLEKEDLAKYLSDKDYQDQLERVAKTQLDRLSLTDNYFASFALDEMVGANATAEDYKEVLESLALGYDHLNGKIEESQKAVDKLADEYENLVGSAAIQNLSEQLIAQNQLLENQEVKLEWIQNTGRDQLATSLEALTREAGGIYQEDYFKNLVMNEDGSINAEGLAELRRLYARDDMLGPEAEAWNNVFDNIEKYQKDWEDTEKAIKETNDALKELALKRLEATLTLELNATEAQRSYQEFLRNIAEEDAFGIIADTTLEDAKTSYNDLISLRIKYLEVGQLQLDWAEEVAKKEEYLAQMQEKALELKSQIEAIEEAQLNNLDAISEAYSEIQSHLDNITNSIEAQKDMLNLMYGDLSSTLGDDIIDQYKELDQELLNNTIARRNAAKEEFDYWTAAAENADPDTDEGKALLEKQAEAAKTYYGIVSDLANVYKDNFLKEIEYSIIDFEKRLTSGKGAKAIKEEWDWMQDHAEDYYDALDRSFELSKLQNKFQTSINDTTNIKIQQRINSLMNEEMAMLKNKDKLSEYDIQRAEKRLSLLEAEIALEDARNSKTEMRLVRGADGAYSYEYVANQEKITEAQEKLAEANQELVNLDEEAYRESLNEFYTMYEEFISALKEASEDGIINQAELDKLDRYKARMNELASDSNYQLTNLNASVTEAASLMGENVNSIINQVITPISSSGIAILVDEMEKQGINVVLDGLINKAQAAQTVYAGNISSLGAELKTATDGAENAATRMLNALVGENGESGLVKALKDEKAVIDELVVSNGPLDQLKKQYDDITDSIKAMTEEWNNAQDARLGLVTVTDSEGNQIKLSQGTIADMSKVGSTGGVTTIQAADGKTRYTLSNIDYKNAMNAIAAQNINKEENSDTVESFKTIQDEGGGKAIAEIQGRHGMASGLGFYISNNAISTPIRNSNISHGNIRMRNGAETKELQKAEFYVGDENLYYFKDAYDPWILVASAANWGWGGNKHNGLYYYYLPSEFIKNANSRLEIGQGRFEASGSLDFRNIGFDTGGYTGAWGPEGRAALLHEKELVLNKHDTENFLSALDILRSLNLSMLDTLGNFKGHFTSSMMQEFMKEFKVEQIVNINAEFPNATDKNEIEEAFKDLYNLAIQRIYER